MSSSQKNVEVDSYLNFIDNIDDIESVSSVNMDKDLKMRNKYKKQTNNTNSGGKKESEGILMTSQSYTDGIKIDSVLYEGLFIIFKTRNTETIGRGGTTNKRQFFDR